MEKAKRVKTWRHANLKNYIPLLSMSGSPPVQPRKSRPQRGGCHMVQASGAKFLLTKLIANTLDPHNPAFDEGRGLMMFKYFMYSTPETAFEERGEGVAECVPMAFSI